MPATTTTTTANAPVAAATTTRPRRLKSKTQVTLTLDTPLLEQLHARSLQDRRSLSNMIEVLLAHALNLKLAPDPEPAPVGSVDPETTPTDA